MAINFVVMRRCFPFYDKYFDSLERIKDHNGIKGVIIYLKDMKSWALNLLENNKYYLPNYAKRRYKNYLIPSRDGIYFVFKRFIDAVLKFDVSLIQYILSLLNIYHRIDGPLSKIDQKKFKDLLTQSEVIPPDINWYIETVTLGRKEVNPPLFSGKIGTLEPTGQSVYISKNRTGSYEKFIGSAVKNFTSDYNEPLYPDVQGQTVLIGDTGGKDRLILIGHPYIQGRLKYLQQYLLDILRGVKTDCTFNQDQGVTLLQDLLKRKTLVYSVDLTDATWNVPYVLQEVLLLELNVPRVLLEDLNLPIYHMGKKIKLMKGQAMGLRPSFPLFALFHNVILTGFCKRLGISTDFRVLGDDLIIWNTELYYKYRKFLEDFQIPQSDKKSFVSTRVGEFAGQIIYRGWNITPIKCRDLTGTSIAQLFTKYRGVLGDTVRFLNKCTVPEMLILGGLAKRYGGLGISNFDSTVRDQGKVLFIEPRIIKSYSGAITIGAGVLQCRLSIVEKVNNSIDYQPRGSVRYLKLRDINLKYNQAVGPVLSIRKECHPGAIMDRVIYGVSDRRTRLTRKSISNVFKWLFPVKDPKEPVLVDVLNIGSPRKIFEQYGIKIPLMPTRQPDKGYLEALGGRIPIRSLSLIQKEVKYGYSRVKLELDIEYSKGKRKA